MRQPTSESELTALGHDLDRLRRRSRRLRHTDWTSWSATIEEANALARRIGQVQPSGLADLVIRYEALTAMSACLLGLSLFLVLMGVSTFAAPMQGHAIIAGIDAFAKLPATFADSVMGLLFLAVVILNLGGNLLLGLAIWRSGILPKWAGVLWAVAALFMYVLGIVYTMITGVQSTPPTVLAGAALVAITGIWIASETTRRQRA